MSIEKPASLCCKGHCGWLWGRNAHTPVNNSSPVLCNEAHETHWFSRAELQGIHVSVFHGDPWRRGRCCLGLSNGRNSSSKHRCRKQESPVGDVHSTPGTQPVDHMLTSRVEMFEEPPDRFPKGCIHSHYYLLSLFLGDSHSD